MVIDSYKTQLVSNIVRQAELIEKAEVIRNHLIDMEIKHGHNSIIKDRTNETKSKQNIKM